jgi:hypothetical protein
VLLAAVRERPNALPHAVLIDVNNQLQVQVPRPPLAKFDHLPKLPGRIHVQERKRRLARIKRLHRKLQHDRRVLADGIEHHRTLELRHHLPHDVDALSFQFLEMRQRSLGHNYA